MANVNRSIAVNLVVGNKEYTIGWFNSNNKCSLGEKQVEAIYNSLSDLKLVGKINNVDATFSINIIDKAEDKDEDVLNQFGIQVDQTSNKSEPSPF